MGRVDPALAAARTAVRAVLADVLADAPAGGPADVPAETPAEAPVEEPLVLVACSGGPDSLALAAVTATEARRAGRSRRSPGRPLRAGAVVVDHGLQPGSDAVAARAAAACRALGLDPVVVRRVIVDGRGDGPEAGARAARHAALDDVAARTGAAAVLLGHTLDDQAEQVLLGLARGAGARSLAGMPARRGLLRRPFLGLRRAQTEAVCRVLGLDPWHDPTNTPSADDVGAPLRSRVRAHVLPVLDDVLGPGVAESLARTADQARADADLLDALADDLLARAAVVGPPGGAGEDRAGEDREGEGPTATSLDVATLAAAPPALRRRALRAAALAVGCPAGALGARHVDALDALVVGWHGQGPAHLPGDARARRACGRLLLQPVAGRPDDARAPRAAPGRT